MKSETTTWRRRTVTLAAAAALAASMPGPALAGQLSVPNTFTAGSPAQASQVNANFTAVQTAVNDNDTRITTNDTRITALEGMTGVVVSKAFGAGSMMQPGTTWAFVGPTLVVTIAAGQRLEVQASTTFGVSTTSSVVSTGICYKQGAGAVTNFETGNVQDTTAAPGYTTIDSFTLVAPGAGTYTVGMCGMSMTPATVDRTAAGRILATVYK